MLSIRMQRLGRKGYPTYRVVVQNSRQSPSSGKYVALLGSYNPHSKQATLVKDKAEFYLEHGAQPSDRVAALFKSEKIKLPKWVGEPTRQNRTIRNPDKLRKNRPAEPPAQIHPPNSSERVSEDKEEVPAGEEAKEESAATPAETESGETPAADTPAENADEAAPVAEAPAAETTAEAPSEEPKEEAAVEEVVAEASAQQPTAENSEEVKADEPAAETEVKPADEKAKS